MAQSKMLKIFADAFYGDLKKHISASVFQKGKIVVKTMCGRKESKFLISDKASPDHRTCKNCLKVVQSKKQP